MADETSSFIPQEPLTRVHGQEVGVRRTRTLPYYLVQDTSESMLGVKIAQANAAVGEIVPVLAEREAELHVHFDLRMLTFGGHAEWVVDTPTRPSDFSPDEKSAAGGTPLGAAFDLLAVEMGQLAARHGEHHDVLTPIVLLVSDGRPTDEWKEPLARFLATAPGRASTRGAIAIGDDCDRDVLRAFAGSDSSVRAVTDIYGIASEILAVTMYLTRAGAAMPAAGAIAAGPGMRNGDSSDLYTQWVSGFEGS